MYAFTFHRPQTVRQAAGLLTKNPDAKLLAGGQTLLPTMKLRLAGPPQIIDMSLIEGMSGIELSGRSLTIGAMTRHNRSQHFARGCAGDSGAREARRHDRRSRGSPHGHDWRLDRQQ